MHATEKSGLLHKTGRNDDHNVVNIVLIFASFGTFVLALVFNGLGGSGAGVPDIFYATVGDLSALFELYITPAGFAFSIWSIIYAWLAASLVIFLITIFLKNGEER